MNDPQNARRMHARVRRRYRRNLTFAASGLLFSLFAGMIGYHVIAELSWTDSFLNASMLLGGMGPVNELKTDGAKLFAGAYAIYCGVGFIAGLGLVLSPVVLHALHRFHLTKDE